jgi:hypothetical protein
MHGRATGYAGGERAAGVLLTAGVRLDFTQWVKHVL